MTEPRQAIPARQRGSEDPLTGLLVDYGGVLTNSLTDTMSAWCAADGVSYDGFLVVMRDLLGDAAYVETATNPVHALERGEIAVPDFERELATRLRRPDGGPVPAEGLLTRMFAGFRQQPVMFDIVRRARRAGIRTGLLSNSWGNEYPREGFDEVFDIVVISGEVGMRKPEAAIYRYAARELGLPPEQCVFVDDLAPNIRGAAGVGMVGVHHVSAAETAAELEVLLGVPLLG
ncbi:MAG: HAD family phosphatase [Actinomycetota bacterium]|nr:HAD family phosphatase [Actinomycetota bacterium]